MHCKAPGGSRGLQGAQSLVFKLIMAAYEHVYKCEADLRERSFSFPVFVRPCVKDGERKRERGEEREGGGAAAAPGARPLFHRSLSAVMWG